MNEQASRRYATLVNKDKDTKRVAVYRLVAMAYLPNPDNHPKVNHIDGNSLNDVLDNLEWASYSRDSQHAYDTGLNPNKVAVICYSLEGEEIGRYTSVAEAARATNGSRTAIQLALNGKSKTSGEKIWRYVEPRGE